MTKQFAVGLAVAVLTCGSGTGQAPRGGTDQVEHPSNGILEMTLQPIFPQVWAPPPRDPDRPTVDGAWEGIIEATFKNISGMKIRCTNLLWYMQYDVQVLDSQGNLMRLTSLGQNEYPRRSRTRLYSGPVGVVDLQPSQEFTARLNLTNIFQIKSGEDYTVKVRRLDGLPPVDATGRPASELSATIVIKGGPGGADK